MSIVESTTLGIVQGVAEFLPISSSAHLIVIPWLLGWEDHGLTFDVALHLGTLFALLIYYRKTWIQLALSLKRLRIEHFFNPKKMLGDKDLKVVLFLAIGTAPAVVVGALAQKYVETVFRNPALIAFPLGIVGVTLWLCDRWGSKNRGFETIHVKDVVMIGLAQCLALFPGVSRSGITISTGLLRGLSRSTAAELSFFLSFPITLGACILKLRHLTATDLTPVFLTGVSTSAISGYLAIWLLMGLVKSRSFLVFAVYRVVLSGTILALVFGFGRAV